MRRGVRFDPATHPGAEDLVFRRLVGRLAELIPGCVVHGDEICQRLHTLFDALSHRLVGVELRFLREHADGVARLEMNVPVELPVEAGEDSQERTLARAVEAQHADLRAVKERQADVSDDLLPLDRLRDANHREYNLGLVRLCHACAKPYPPRPAAQAVTEAQPNQNHFTGGNEGDGANERSNAVS